MNIKINSALMAVSMTVSVVSMSAGDWSQYRGPEISGASKDSISTAWAAGGPKQVWKIPTPLGFSSFSIAGGKVYTQIARSADGSPKEFIVAMDAATGKELWAYEIGIGKYDRGGDSGTEDNKGGDGPRSTPAVNGGRVYVFDQFLVLSCLDANTGKLIWKKDMTQEYAGRNIGWKSALSPVVDGNLVFVAGGGAGQSLLAFDKATGKLAWKGLDEKITHATPVVATLHGVRQVIYFMQSGLVAVSASEGQELWRFPFRYNVSTASSPVVCGDDIVYCSAGYGVGGGACKVTKEGDKFTATQLYKIEGDKKIANHWSTPVYKDGYLYGCFSFKEYGRGPLKCVDVKTGEIKWSKEGFGAGQVLLAGDKVVVLADDGQVVLVEATPTEFKEVARTKAVEGKCWSTPALSNGRLYVRSTKEGACLDVSR